MEKLLEFWNLICANFDADEIEEVLESNEFDPAKLETENLKKLDDDEIRILFANLVYIALNEFFGGDFETTYDVLSDIGVDQETIDYLLDF